jgi:leader peptidase (prepilin peptidase)/N-methyltransferase
MLGACVGSFLNVVIYRLPIGQSIVFPPSHCPQCGRSILWYDNIPLISWLNLRGRCRFCKTSISPRYILVEALTACLVAGLYVCYYVLDLRDGGGTFQQNWPIFLAHAALLCCLLVCTMVDIEKWIVPLEVCWFVSLVGLACNTAKPMNWLPEISPATGAASLGATVGLGIGLLAMRFGWIRRSFIDAEDKPVTETKNQHGKKAPISVAATLQDGVNPRLEMGWELLFLLPAFVLAIVAVLAVKYVPAIRVPWLGWTQSEVVGPHLNGFLAALFGYLIGGLWIWGARILGTLGFGKEAMGLGDVHILAAVGAVTGWIVPSMVFFVAPVFGLVWALYLLIGRKQKELPYGPWLAAATGVTLLFYDAFWDLLEPYRNALG